jgi:hypothetical protein
MKLTADGSNTAALIEPPTDEVRVAAAAQPLAPNASANRQAPPSNRSRLTNISNIVSNSRLSFTVGD